MCNAGNGHALVHVLESAVQAALAEHREEQAATLQGVAVAVHHLYEQVHLPKYPDALSDEIAWSTLRSAWSDEEYWLSVEELLLVSCHVGPDLQIYTHSWQPDGNGVFEPLDRGRLPPLSPDGFERVLLSIDEELHCGQHFPRILTTTAWSAYQAANDEATESSSAASSASSVSTDDDESSSSSAASEVPPASRPRGPCLRDL